MMNFAEASMRRPRSLNFTFLKNLARPAVLTAGSLLALSSAVPADAIGVLGPHAVHIIRTHFPQVRARRSQVSEVRYSKSVSTRQRNHATHLASTVKEKPLPSKRRGKVPPVKTVVYEPQEYVDKLKSEQITEGVVYKSYKSGVAINVLDIDLMGSPVHVRPIMAGDSFNQLKDVSDHAKQAHALAAVNANYFKKDGTPLGTLIVNGEWVAGPLYDRISMGITKTGFVRMDRVKLGGLLDTSNTSAPTIWINNINQPRRTGSRLVAYTRRWSDKVKLPYQGCLVAIDATGAVVDKATKEIVVPYGGMVLTDSKGGVIENLKVGDRTHMNWKTAPDTWSDVVEAVSGGPILIKNGQIFVDLKDERFRTSWTSSSIKARTAAAVTANNHLLLATIEGPHTMWDLAKFLQKLGATEALNLDGGGSTTMVVNGQTVTRAPASAQRRVASSIGVFIGADRAPLHSNYTPHGDITEFLGDSDNSDESTSSNLATFSPANR